jgi:hypothetical protein
MIILPAIGILLALHPAREEFFRRGAALSRTRRTRTVDPLLTIDRQMVAT